MTRIKKQQGEKFIFACFYSLCLFVGLFVYLLVEFTKVPEEPETTTEDTLQPTAPVDDGYEPDFNTSGNSDWHWAICLIITVASGTFILVAPRILQKLLLVVIQLRHGEEEVLKLTQKTSKEVKVVVECEDEESQLVNNAHDSQRSSKSSRANDARIHPVGKTQTPLEDDEHQEDSEVSTLHKIVGPEIAKKITLKKGQDTSQRLLKGVSSGSLWNEKTQLRNTELARLDNEFSKDFIFDKHQDHS